ncbi:classical arabinogalactan protein 25-like [Diospyros lotus]|uniref:classical arabinogalactan protein 25-like n=1 Tax=Diospyros lotus TaxID=55363 RepID=UPI00225310CF|nr:classical arabinogalactan protein 25-like [Diospyros lotus]
MASFRLLILMPFIIAFMASPLHSLSSELKLGDAPTTISASPALMPNPPFAELSPEIAPLFPSPGGELPSPAGSNSLPTIPSNPSPPNPDEIAGFAPDSAISPSGSKLASSASSLNSPGFLNSAILMGFLAFW